MKVKIINSNWVPIWVDCRFNKKGILEIDIVRHKLYEKFGYVKVKDSKIIRVGENEKGKEE